MKPFQGFEDLWCCCCASSTISVESLGTIFVDPAAYADPVAWHAAARGSAGVAHPEGGGRGLPRLLGHHDPCRRDGGRAQARGLHQRPVADLTPPSLWRGRAPVKTLIQLDGDEHKAHRNIVNDWFKPVNLKSHAGPDRHLARARWIGWRPGRPLRLRQRRRRALPAAGDPGHPGLPEEDYPRMLQLTQELFGAEDPDIARLVEDQSSSTSSSTS